eukprot:g2229.t1
MASSCVRLGQKSHHHMQRKAFLDRRYAENPPSGFGMGQGQYGKQSSIPDTEVQYVHKDEYGNTHLLTRELSHQERYKTLAKSNDRGKLVMGIHRTFWHKGISATVGRGHKIEKGKGMTYGVFSTTGDGVDSYGRPLTALELLRKKENDKKLALIRAEKKKRAEMYKSHNGSNRHGSTSENMSEGLLSQLNEQQRVDAVLEAQRMSALKSKSAGRAGLLALEQRIADRNRQREEEIEAQKEAITNTFTQQSSGSKRRASRGSRQWDTSNTDESKLDEGTAHVLSTGDSSFSNSNPVATATSIC